jgi:hypothetical protein
MMHRSLAIRNRVALFVLGVAAVTASVLLLRSRLLLDRPARNGRMAGLDGLYRAGL